MLNKVHNYIKEHKMIHKGDRIVVGVSGGADSVCLFHVLNQLKEEYELTLYVVHVNHGIRMEEADKDEAYVKTLCKEYGVFYQAVKADVISKSKLEGLSEEEAGRITRYEAFYQCFNENKCNKIAIAHNKNDNAETILFHMFRGSGLLGLSGIRPIRDEIIRPLLGIERYEIEYYLKEANMKYCNDHTNDTDDYSRNRIRHHILGYAKEHINNQSVSHIVAASEQIIEVNSYIDTKIKEAYASLVECNEKNFYRFNISTFKNEDIVIQKGIIRKILYAVGNQGKDIEYIHTKQILELLEKSVGKFINLPYGIVAKREYTSLLIGKKEDIVFDSMKKKGENVEDIIVSLEEKTECKIYVPSLEKTIFFRLLKCEKNRIIPRNGYTKWFDYDKIKNTVLIRTRAEGDFIHIDDRGNKKKLKSYFIDQKIPKEERDGKILIADGSHILWIVGDRNSEGYKINEETKVVLEISLNGGK